MAHPPNHGKSWSKSEIQQVKREARDANIPTEQIAQNHGRTVGSIRDLARP
jgi:hypothetical protein